MVNNPTASLICSTYNAPIFLEMVLKSLRLQESSDYELIIADDGSGPETKQLIERYQKDFPVTIKHVWHQDNGWQKSQIHNKAIRQSLGELLIFLDGDCIVGRHYLRDHLDTFKKNKENYVLMGRRVDLGEKLASTLTPDNFEGKLFSPLALPLLRSCVVGDSRAYMRRISIRNKLLRFLYQANDVDDLLGANFSLPRECMYRINGFNEEYQRGEDGDIFVRLRNSGIRPIGMKYFAVVFHLWHSSGDYQYVDDNYDKIMKLTDYKWTNIGLK